MINKLEIEKEKWNVLNDTKMEDYKKKENRE